MDIELYSLSGEQRDFLEFVLYELEHDLTGMAYLSCRPMIGRINDILKMKYYNNFDQAVLNNLYTGLEKNGYRLKEYKK